MSRSFVKYGQKIQTVYPNEKLLEDLERYCDVAKGQGATDAKIINSSDVIVDQRVKYKCQYPLCKSYGTSMNCPPYTAEVAETENLLKLYDYGVLIMFKYPADRMKDKAKSVLDRRNLTKAIATLESAAFYDGYYFSMGFGAGPCKGTWCSDQNSCSALEGKGCRYASFTRASMESVGIDVYKMAAKQGWDIYPIGSSCLATDIPEGTRVGLVLIG